MKWKPAARIGGVRQSYFCDGTSRGFISQGLPRVAARLRDNFAGLFFITRRGGSRRVRLRTARERRARAGRREARPRTCRHFHRISLTGRRKETNELNGATNFLSCRHSRARQKLAALRPPPETREGDTVPSLRSQQLKVCCPASLAALRMSAGSDIGLTSTFVLPTRRCKASWCKNNNTALLYR